MHRLVIADDHPVVHHAVRAALPSQAFRVVAECTRGDTALEAVRTLKPNLLVLDLQLPGVEGITVLRRLRTLGTPVRVLVLSCEDDRDGGLRALRAGADGYVAKSSPIGQLGCAIDAVARGQRCFRPEVTQRLRASSAMDDDALLGSLSDREFDVLKGLATGRSYRELADDLAVDPKTISAVRGRLSRKLGTPSLAALIEFARLNNVAPN